MRNYRKGLSISLFAFALLSFFTLAQTSSTLSSIVQPKDLMPILQSKNNIIISVVAAFINNIHDVPKMIFELFQTVQISFYILAALWLIYLVPILKLKYLIVILTIPLLFLGLMLGIVFSLYANSVNEALNTINGVSTVIKYLSYLGIVYSMSLITLIVCDFVEVTHQIDYNDYVEGVIE